MQAKAFRLPLYFLGAMPTLQFGDQAKELWLQTVFSIFKVSQSGFILLKITIKWKESLVLEDESEAGLLRDTDSSSELLNKRGERGIWESMNQDK